VGQEVVLLTVLVPGSPGKAELRGSSWSVLGEGEELLLRGARCVVVSVDGLTLRVRAAETVQPGIPI